MSSFAAFEFPLTSPVQFVGWLLPEEAASCCLYRWQGLLSFCKLLHVVVVLRSGCVCVPFIHSSIGDDVYFVLHIGWVSL